MEEILASIRRIIADDDAGKPKPAEAARPAVPPPPAAVAPPQTVIPAAPTFAPEPPPAPEPDPAEDVLDLTPAMEVTNGGPAGFQTIKPAQDLVFEDPVRVQPAPEPEPAPDDIVDFAPPTSTVDAARRNFEHDMGDERSILAQSTVQAVDSAFNTLAHSVLVQNSQTLDGLVREMLRPMLKAWLDDNLPNLVERMVRAEIERVSRGH